ncbi:crossover junction endodeoxyribonuclease RuvC [Sphingomicrobium marinum]|uniref:crossover junction endodeoxyribonuclease RuvC n=1 Tax=Sphingomicrobium marinum TaxID=1227950 RepID=UPI00223E9D18|nr:crossover junction endodeoxyribonuclease RuvC [Sphingomicrobium marinum]
MIVLGIDPGLGTTGWGLIEAAGNRLIHLGNGQIKSPAKAPLPARLAILAHHLEEVIEEAEPDCAAIEEVFVNKNAQSTLKLAQARGALLLCCARAGLELDEYAPRLVKKAVVGTGSAEKAQIHAMVGRLMPGCDIAGPDAADALAVAITHAHHARAPR